MTKTSISKKELITLFVLGTLLFSAIVFLFPMVHADDNAQIVIEIVIKVLKFIAIVVGVIFILVGIFKFAVAHANEQGPEQNKAIMMMATGLVLILLFTVVINNDVETKLVQIVNNAGQ